MLSLLIAVLNFGDDQEIKLTHEADTKMILSSAVDEFMLELKVSMLEHAVNLVLHRSSSSPADMMLWCYWYIWLR